MNRDKKNVYPFPISIISLIMTARRDLEDHGSVDTKIFIAPEWRDTGCVISTCLVAIEPQFVNPLPLDVKIERDAGTYEGITITAAKVKFKLGLDLGGEDESLQGKALERMFGDGLDYRWAFVKRHCVYTIGSDADKTIQELIDQVRAGGPKGIASEIKTAFETIIPEIEKQQQHQK